MPETLNNHQTNNRIMNDETKPTETANDGSAQPAGDGPRPTDRPLLWREDQDDHGNSTHSALSSTWVDAEDNPLHQWRARCVLRNNQAEWIISETDEALIGEVPDRYRHWRSAEDAMAECQRRENDIRAMLAGTARAEQPAQEPETAPTVLDEHGFAPTHTVRAHWSRNEGRLHFTRVWKRPDGGMEQEREITDRDEERECMRGYFTQRMVEELVTRIVTGGFGRMIWETPFATCVMQAELDFLRVSSLTLTIRRGNGVVEDIDMQPPTIKRVMSLIARQMHARQLQLEQELGNVDIRELQEQIVRSARALGIEAAPPPLTKDEPGVLPVTLEDFEAATGKGAGGMTRDMKGGPQA